MHSQGCHVCTRGHHRAMVVAMVREAAMELEQGIVALVLLVLGQVATDSCICCYSTGIRWGKRPLRSTTYDRRFHCREQRRSGDVANQRRLHSRTATSTCTYQGSLHCRHRMPANLLEQDQLIARPLHRRRSRVSIREMTHNCPGPQPCTCEGFQHDQHSIPEGVQLAQGRGSRQRN